MRYSWESARGASGNRSSAKETGHSIVKPTDNGVVFVFRSEYLRVS